MGNELGQFGDIFVWNSKHALLRQMRNSADIVGREDIYHR